MEPATYTARTPLQRMMLEKALAMAEEMEQVGDAAADGEVLDTLETLAVDRGRDFTRQSLQGALGQQLSDVEKKLPRTGNAPVADGDATKAAASDRC